MTGSSSAALLLGTLFFFLVSSSVSQSDSFSAKVSHWNSPASGKSKSERFTNAVALSRSRHSRRRLIERRNVTYESLVTPDPYHSYMSMQITVGYPPRIFSALVDTGSSLIWLKAKSDSCNPLYNSSTYKPITDLEYCASFLELDTFQKCGGHGNVKCQFLANYGSGRVTGNAGTDTLWLHLRGEREPVPFKDVVLGMVTGTHSVEGFDGIVGLGPGLSSLVSQLGSEFGSKFSYCFVDGEHGNYTTPIYFGSRAELGGGRYVQKTPFLPISAQLYALNLTSVVVGNSSFPVDSVESPLIIDSGTTLTMLTSDLFDPVMRAYDEVVGLEPMDSLSVPHCYNVSGLEGFRFPAMTLQLENAVMVIEGENVVVDIGDGVFCAAVDLADDDRQNILGNHFQQNYHILYDQDESSLSFVKSRCHLLHT